MIIDTTLRSSIERIFDSIAAFFRSVLPREKMAVIDEELIIEELIMTELINWLIECRVKLPKIAHPAGLAGFFKEIADQVEELRRYYPRNQNMDDTFFQILYDMEENKIVKFRVIKFKSLSAEVEAEIKKAKNRFLVFQNF